MDVPAHSISPEELPRKSFTYLNPGVTTCVPMMFQTKVYNKVPGLPSSGTRTVTAKDRLSLILPDLSLGIRNLSTHHVFDRVIGIAVQSEIQLLYIQGSYLFFPTPSQKFYFGAGVTCGLYHLEDSYLLPPTFIYVNLPITVGYQFPSKKSFQFIQIQATPFGTGTLSYGVGF